MKDINLLPEEVKETEYVQPPRGGGSPVKLLFGLVIAVVLVTVSILMPMLNIRQKEQELENLRAEIESEKYDVVREVRNDLSNINSVLASKTDVIGTIDSSNHPVSEVITSVYNSAPLRVAVNNIAYNEQRARITGIAQDNVAFAEFISAINRVTLLNISGSPSYDESTGTFQLTIRVSGEGA
ncbi:hypothetical protein RBH29_05240 [Herbivorax sp. ANBcel31]|uniref:PilN domain-containing protein n=1 Tax=Herbivorax sp. ANBcel31 TaxID=3069754 RepID=UPI0027B6BC4B|nr:hypothetical protein [Herbivorax sp. ANBcel31]MDQ2085840.1 hypothetical protein [Herbivorax sp. ANBcel31]